MDRILSQQLKRQQENNPHKRMHKVVFIVVVACLTVQVLEGAFIIPYILVHFGFPKLSIKEICDEMYIIVYKNEDRECNFPYPLFSGPEPWKYKDMTDVIGSPVPPRPLYEGFGFREVIQRREERMARKAAEAAAEAKAAEVNASEVNASDVKSEEKNGEANSSDTKLLQDPLTLQRQKADTGSLATSNLSVSARWTIDYTGNRNGN